MADFARQRRTGRTKRMNKRWIALVGLILAAGMGLSAPASAQVKVLMSNGFKAAYTDVLPDFEKRTGISVTTSAGPSQGDGPTTIGAQLRRGVAADVVILSKNGLTDLIKDGEIAAGTDVDLAQAPLGLAVRSGAPKPDISTVEAFRQTILRAKSITFQSSTVIYLRDTLLPQLGIADNVMAKHSEIGPLAVASGAAEIAIAPVSEIFHVPGVDYVGPIPAQIQLVQTFSAAVVSGSKQEAAAKSLIAFLASDEAKAAIRKNGMEPSH
jgi:molybdate transport system substrate-binding protein